MDNKIDVIPVVELQGILIEFKKELLAEIRMLIRDNSNKIENKWMKSTEVKEVLKISHGKLQTMRKSGEIPYTKIGGSLFYDREDILTMFESLKVNRKNDENREIDFRRTDRQAA